MTMPATVTRKSSGQQTVAAPNMNQGADPLRAGELRDDLAAQDLTAPSSPASASAPTAAANEDSTPPQSADSSGATSSDEEDSQGKW